MERWDDLCISKHLAALIIKNCKFPQNISRIKTFLTEQARNVAFYCNYYYLLWVFASPLFSVRYFLLPLSYFRCFNVPDLVSTWSFHYVILPSAFSSVYLAITYVWVFFSHLFHNSLVTGIRFNYINFHTTHYSSYNFGKIYTFYSYKILHKIQVGYTYQVFLLILLLYVL